MYKQRRLVIVSDLVPRGRKGRQGVRLWAYGYADLAALYGVPEATVRSRVKRGKLKPGDLLSVLRSLVDIGWQLPPAK